MPRITELIPEPIFQKLRYQKDIDGFGDKSWTDWFRHTTKDVSLDRTVGELLGDATRDTLAMLWMKNFAANIQNGLVSDGKVWQLPKLKTPALVVGAGPSIKAKQHLETLKDWIQQDIARRSLLTIFATDRMLIPLLHVGIAPDYVVSVDGNTEKIARFYDDPLVKATANGVWPKAILAATVSPTVVQACKTNNIPVHWFVAMLDQFTLTNNITRLMHFMVDATALNCGGNAGSSSWAIANYLEASEVALIGMDYGYLKGTPIEETAYYGTLKDKAKNANEIFALYFNYHNPDLDIDCYSDIMFGHYKEAFMNMLDLAQKIRAFKTVNCTEGGILHGSQLTSMKLKDWLNKLETKVAQ